METFAMQKLARGLDNSYWTTFCFEPLYVTIAHQRNSKHLRYNNTRAGAVERLRR